MATAIMATGDEIVHGDTLNTNGQNIAQILSSEGIPLGYHVACSDKENDLVDCLDFLSGRHDTIIIIGGLGPTTDDLTRFALARFTGTELIQHPEALKHIEQRLSASKVAINQGNLQQCLFPASATLIPNPNGSAVGCCFKWQNKTFILLPGPPRECLPMVHQHVLPLLLQEKLSHKQIIKWRVFGVAESEIGQVLEDALAFIDCATGYRLDTPYIEFKVKCTADLVPIVKSIIDPILMPHIIASMEKKASDNLYDLILSKNKAITIIDDATGGALESLLVKPGIKHLVHFHKQGETELNFHLSGLDEYWNQEAIKGTSHLVIHYSNQTQEGAERHEIPYRSPLVLLYAVEWLSFRLFHLINQLH